tara:strand:+ start:122 stop:352 length:231 start_codon:yes stop_codon:yes gene_type:complete
METVKAIEEFLNRGEDFPHNNYEINGNELMIETETNQQGYAWIGLAQHNIENGCKAVKEYNYMLIEPRRLIIYFKQ